MNRLQRRLAFFSSLFCLNRAALAMSQKKKGKKTSTRVALLTAYQSKVEKLGGEGEGGGQVICVLEQRGEILTA